MLQSTLAQIGSWTDASNAHFAHIALDPLAINRRELWLKQHRQLARAIERVRGVEFVDAMLDRHLLRRWRYRLIVQTAPRDAEQVSLGRKRQRVGIMVEKRVPFGMAHDGNLFSEK